MKGWGLVLLGGTAMGALAAGRVGSDWAGAPWVIGAVLAVFVVAVLWGLS